MVFDWKIRGLYPVPAQAAGEELYRIHNERGKIDPADVVDASRPLDAVLHPCFEWRDEVAAEKWREQQARNVCNHLVVVAERDDKPPVSVRAVYHVQGTYQPTEVIVRHEDKYAELQRTCLREFEAVRKKFALLSDRDGVKEIFDAIDRAVAEERAT